VAEPTPVKETNGLDAEELSREPVEPGIENEN
jgi:hypothetical protein